MRPLHLLLAAAISVPLGLLACTPASDDVVDGDDDDFLGADGKADGETLSDAEVRGVLAVVNTADRETLDVDCHLTSKAAKNITKHRAARDRQLDTDDDNDYDTLKELDDITGVGPNSLRAILEYARAQGLVDDEPQDDDGLCAESHAGQTPAGQRTTICDRLHAEPPLVRLPADDVANQDAVTIHVGLVSMGAGRLQAIDRQGKRWELVDSDGQELDLDAPPAGLDVANQLQAVFALEGKITSLDFFGQPSPALEVHELKPILWIPGKVLDERLLGAWEADVSLRTGDGHFDDEHTTKVRFLFTDSQDNGQLFANMDIDGADGQRVSGVIDNWDAAAIDSSGHCLPALSDLGEKNPFHGAAAGAVSLYRHPNMHGIHDEVLVLEYPQGSDTSVNGMGNMELVTPAALIQLRAHEDFTTTTIYPHGTPSGHMVKNLQRVSPEAGSTACSP